MYLSMICYERHLTVNVGNKVEDSEPQMALMYSPLLSILFSQADNPTISQSSLFATGTLEELSQC